MTNFYAFLGVKMDESGKNELLKKRIIEEAEKDGCVVVCAFDDDETHKKRRNTKRSLILESIILENELRYCRFSERKSKIESAEYFAVFGNPEKTREIIEKEQDAFRALHFYDDIPSVLEGKLFYHPATDKECADFDKRHELHLGEEHLDLRPYVVGPWVYDSKSRIYRSGQYLCSLRFPTENSPDYVASIGTVIPIGVLIKKITAKTLEEVFDGMKKWKK